MYSKEINELIDPQILQAAERKNVYIRASSNQYGPTDEVVFQFPSNKDKYSEYLDFRNAYLQYDIIGVNLIGGVSESRTISLHRYSNNALAVATGGSYRVRVNDYITGTIAFGALFSAVQTAVQTILDTYYPGLVITASAPASAFSTVDTFAFVLSGHDQNDYGVLENFLRVDVPSEFSSLTNGELLSAENAVIATSVLSTPRLCRNSTTVINRVYAAIGSALFNINSVNILENMLLTACDTEIVRNYDFSRSGTNFGLNLELVRRQVFPMRALPIFNSLILPGFMKEPLEIRFTLESAIKSLVVANTSQSYLLTNVEINYHTLKLSQSVCDTIYSRALSGDLAIRFETWQNDSESISSSDVSLDQILNYSYQNVTGLLSAITANEDTSLVAPFIGYPDKLNRFYKEGVQGYRLEASNGKFYPIDQIQILGNSLYSTGESENEFVRTVGLELGGFDYGRQSCLGFLTYGGLNSYFDIHRNSFLSPSFVMAIDLSSEKSENKICKNGISMKGSTDNRFKILNMVATKNGILNTFIKYCGIIAIRPDLSTLILN